MFEALVDVCTLQDEAAGVAGGPGSFLHEQATALLAVGGHRKGKYTPLAALTPR